MAWRLAHDGEADSVYPLPRTRHRACGNSDHATPTRSIMAASLGCGARRMAAAPAEESGCAPWRGRERGRGGEGAPEHAGAGGAIEIGLRAGAGKMQDAVERPPRQRHRDRRREALDLDRAINHRGQERHAARGKIAGAVLAGEIE